LRDQHIGKTPPHLRSFSLGFSRRPTFLIESSAVPPSFAEPINVAFWHEPEMQSRHVRC
jgi:hypothetical protein